MTAEEETNSAATILGVHTAMAWPTAREIERDPGARESILAFTEARMTRLVRMYPDLLEAAQAACGVVARAADGKPAAPFRLHG